jgi:hypothetical protein
MRHAAHAAERQLLVMAALAAAQPQEAMRRHAAPEIGIEPSVDGLWSHRSGAGFGVRSVP